MDLLEQFEQCSVLLKDFYFQKKAGLKEVCAFHQIFQKDYDRIFDLMNTPLSFSKMNERLKDEWQQVEIVTSPGTVI